MIVAASFIERPEWEPPPARIRGRVVGLHKNDAVEWHTEPFGDELGEARLVPLPRVHRAHHQLDLAVGQHRDLGALARARPR